MKKKDAAMIRKIKRFPEEFDNLKSQFVTSSWEGTRKLSLAFSE